MFVCDIGIKTWSLLEDIWRASAFLRKQVLLHKDGEHLYCAFRREEASPNLPAPLQGPPSCVSQSLADQWSRVPSSLPCAGDSVCEDGLRTPPRAAQPSRTRPSGTGAHSPAGSPPAAPRSPRAQRSRAWGTAGKVRVWGRSRGQKRWAAARERGGQEQSAEAGRSFLTRARG